MYQTLVASISKVDSVCRYGEKNPGFQEQVPEEASRDLVEKPWNQWLFEGWSTHSQDTKNRYLQPSRGVSWFGHVTRDDIFMWQDKTVLQGTLKGGGGPVARERTGLRTRSGLVLKITQNRSERRALSTSIYGLQPTTDVGQETND